MRKASSDLSRLGLTTGALAAGLLSVFFASSLEAPMAPAQPVKTGAIIHARAYSTPRENPHPEFGQLSPFDKLGVGTSAPRANAPRDLRIVLAWAR